MVTAVLFSGLLQRLPSWYPTSSSGMTSASTAAATPVSRTSTAPTVPSTPFGRHHLRHGERPWRPASSAASYSDDLVGDWTFGVLLGGLGLRAGPHVPGVSASGRQGHPLRRRAGAAAELAGAADRLGLFLRLWLPPAMFPWPPRHGQHAGIRVFRCWAITGCTPSCLRRGACVWRHRENIQRLLPGTEKKFQVARQRPRQRRGAA